MTLAIRGDRASLRLQLGPRTWLLAVARGFGSIGGLTTEAALLARLRAECERQKRSVRFRRTMDRAQGAAAAILAMLRRVNFDLYTATASHEDYVTAAASLTAVLVVEERAFVMQAGSTAAYLAHAGEVIALSGDDFLEGRGASLLFRAFAVGPALDVEVSSAALAHGDVIVLLDRRLRAPADRRALLAQLEAASAGEHVLIARIERDEPTENRSPNVAQTAALRPVCARIAAALAFLIAMVLGR